MFSVFDFVMISIVAALVGGLSGFFGVGGAFLLVPLLTIVLKVPVKLAVGACAFQILGLATTSLLARRIQRPQLRLPLILAGGLLCGVLAGAQILEQANSVGRTQILGKEVDFADFLVLSVYCLLLSILGVLSFWETAHSNSAQRRGGWSGLRIPAHDDLSGISATSIICLSWLGLAVGGLSGLLGISGGLILLPALTSLAGMRTQDAVIASLLTVWIASAQATAVHAFHGNVNLVLAIVLLMAGTIGARLGSELGLRVHGRRFRRSLSYLLLGTAGLIAVRLVWLFAAGP